MSHPNADLITRFYQAFQQLDAERMVSCYAPDVRFSDPAFGTLTGDDAADMWRMLTTRAKKFSLTFSDVQADANGGSAKWVATYLFSQTGRTVVNRIQASFVIRDGLIVEHRDHFDMWRWSAQALGFQGMLIGWTPLLKNTVRRQARNGLRQFQASRASDEQQGVEARS
ncbi:nuclear transport factor 2 family protein [Pseudomonas sp. MM211]|uniref:nuclear transport factor 2 family protein n=1 Tax=Pseudomonas sp. MM211 TaxID=2866808 RepID=UPI001CEDB7F7|nr:nuclear transport factor 2 family protein [Pseudomonas sp. MM211]UCJ18745.1 nuclear transport factor 2 family protein [Pseudomonas sp. MM211]